MPRYSDATKRDPYRNYNFRILMDGLPVAACKKMSKLAGTIDVVKFRAGDSQYAVTELSPGRINYEPVTLEAGLTQDKTFQTWATALMVNEAMTSAVRAVEPLFRKEITIQVFDIDHLTVVRKYILQQGLVLPVHGDVGSDRRRQRRDHRVDPDRARRLQPDRHGELTAGRGAP